MLSAVTPPQTPGLPVLLRVPSKGAPLLAQKRNLEMRASPAVEYFNTTPLRVRGIPIPGNSWNFTIDAPFSKVPGEARPCLPSL